jgi:DNA polymerase-4
MELFHKLFNRRQLVRQIGVSMRKLVRGCHQINLLDDSEEQIHLYQKIDYLRKKYGNSEIVTRASILDLDYRVHNPWTGERPTPPAHRHI